MVYAPDLDLIRVADLIIVLERNQNIGRVGDCEWLASPFDEKPEWTVTIKKHRSAAVFNPKPQPVTQDFAFMVQEASTWCGYRVPDEEVWVVCLISANMLLEARLHVREREAEEHKLRAQMAQAQAPAEKIGRPTLEEILRGAVTKGI